jgi:acyl-CoA thioesterase-1
MSIRPLFKAFMAFVVVFVFAVTSALAADAPKTLMIFGDSLVAGYGLSADQAFPAQLQKKLTEAGHDIRVINAGVSGDTTSGGVTRLEWTLKQNPDYVVVVLGGNDMLRSVDPKVTRDNLDKIMKTLTDRKIPTLLAGMKSFSNLGAGFGRAYDEMYRDMADKYDAGYYPFFLDGVAFDALLNQDDGVHPNALGVAVITDKIFPDVVDLIK